MTTLTRLQAWVALGEGETQEFKRSTANLERGTQTICGMLNRGGGRVLYGVRPDGCIEGQQTSDRTVEKITGELGHISPPVFPEVERLQLEDGQEVLTVTVGRGNQRPYTYQGRAYLRVGNSTQEMSAEEYNAMLLEANCCPLSTRSAACAWPVSGTLTAANFWTIRKSPPTPLN